MKNAFCLLENQFQPARSEVPWALIGIRYTPFGFDWHKINTIILDTLVVMSARPQEYGTLTVLS